MRLLHLTLLYCVLNIMSSDTALEYPPSSPAKNVKPIAANPVTTKGVEPAATNIIFQSKDGGQTWQDISNGLPEIEQPVNFFAEESGLYLHVKDVLYRSKRNLKTPVWEKENVSNHHTVLDTQLGLLSKVLVSWPSTHSIRTIFETSDGAVFLGYDREVYKSTDKGKNWKKVQNEGMNIVELEGVLMATGTKGIARSTDKGEHWEWVISEGGVGIALESIKGGFAAITYSTVSKTRRIRISMDKGKTWNAIDEGLRPSLSISSIKQMGKYLFCGHPDGIFRSSDMGKTWSMVHSKFNFSNIPSILDFTDDKKVFSVYVSGNIVYALLRNAGC